MAAWAQSVAAENTSQQVTQPAQQQPQTEQTAPAAEDSGSDDPLTLFPHSESSRYWISGQANVVFQWHPSFPAQYTGPNSLTPAAQSATTHILTLYTGYELSHTTELFADVEDSTGGGIGTAVGLAGYTDLDSVRTVQGIALSKAPYLARLMLRQIVPLTQERVAESATSSISLLRFRRGESSFASENSTWSTSSM